MIAAAVVGGTTSAIAGGKFSNGALTGAFTQMFNAESANATRAKLQKTINDWWAKTEKTEKTRNGITAVSSTYKIYSGVNQLREALTIGADFNELLNSIDLMNKEQIEFLYPDLKSVHMPSLGGLRDLARMHIVSWSRNNLYATRAVQGSLLLRGGGNIANGVLSIPYKAIGITTFLMTSANVSYSKIND